MFIQIAKKDLDRFNYNSNNDIKMLVPFTMISVAYTIYGQNNTVTTSVEEMWHLVTRGKRKLRKAQRENLLDWFYWFTDNEDITFEDEFTFTVSQYKNEKFIKLDMKHITNIFTEYRFDNIDMALAITLRLLSHMNGEYIGMTRNALLQKIKHDYIGRDVFDIDKPNTWFQKYNMEDWNEMSRNLVAFPKIDDLLKTRYDSDKQIMDKPFIYEDNFNDHITKLEKIGVVCKVQTTYGQHRNKVVFCLVEHKEVVEQLYKRYEDLVEYNIEHPSEEEEPTEPQQPKRSGRNSGRAKQPTETVEPQQPTEQPKQFGIPRGGKRKASGASDLASLEHGCTSDANKKVHEKARARKWNNTIDITDNNGKEIEFDLTDLYIQPKCFERVNRDKRW